MWVRVSGPGPERRTVSSGPDVEKRNCPTLAPSPSRKPKTQYFNNSRLPWPICTAMLKHLLISAWAKASVITRDCCRSSAYRSTRGREAVFGHVGGQVVEHAALAEQGMGSGLDGVELEVAVHAEACGGAEQCEQRDGEGVEEQQAVARSGSVMRTEPRPRSKRRSLVSRKSAQLHSRSILNGRAIASRRRAASLAARREGSPTCIGSHAHDRADRAPRRGDPRPRAACPPGRSWPTQSTGRARG